ncbi:MAG: hypothetical protein WKF37_03520 [Bryobacteraceae bacterium]
MLARPWVAEIYARENFADEVILYNTAGLKDLQGKWQLCKQLRAKLFDAAILLQNAFEAAALDPAGRESPVDWL